MYGATFEIEGIYLPKHLFVITKRCMYGATFEIEEMYLPFRIFELRREYLQV